MSISVSEFNGVKAYNFSFGKSLPDYLTDGGSKKKNPKNDPEFRKKIELIYDFQFHTSCQHLEVTKDGNYVVAAGIYAPRLKIFDINEMSLKCERGIDSDIIKFKMLSDDYKKVAMICSDRNIEFHAQYGRHFKIRTPKVGRDLEYNPFTCDLIVSSSSDELFRLNLEEGKFLPTLKCSTEEINCLLHHPKLDLLFAGGVAGIVDVFDYQQRKL